MSAEEKIRAQFHRNLLKKLVNAQEKIILDEKSAIKVGLLELVSEDTCNKILDGTYNTDDDPDDWVSRPELMLLTDIIKYFRTKKK